MLDPDLATSNTWRVTSFPATFLMKPGEDAAGMAISAREWNGAAEMRALKTACRMARATSSSNLWTFSRALPPSSRGRQST